MHPIERAVLGINTRKEQNTPQPTKKQPFKRPVMDKLALGILGLERIGTRFVPKSFFGNLEVPASNCGTITEPWKGFFHNFF